MAATEQVSNKTLSICQRGQPVMTRVLCPRSAGLLLGVSLLFATASARASTYNIDQRYGTIGFEIDEAGVFTSKGEFRHFGGALSLDFQHPERSFIDVAAAADSAQIPGPDAVAMLRSPDYFDAARFRQIHYVSSGIAPLGGDRYRIDGTIEIRGIKRSQAFEAQLVARTHDPKLGADVADFVVKGALLRSQFGMVANQDFISDTVRLVIRIRLTLGPDDHAK